MSKRSKKIIYVILAIVIIVGILAINILIPAPNPNDNGTNTVKEETDTRDVLYKYNSEDFDYSKLESGGFTIDYTTANNGTAKEGIILHKDNSCYYYATFKMSDGYYNLLSDSCTYKVDNNSISLTVDVTNTYIPTNGTSTQTESLKGQVITGEFLDNWKYLQINGMSYKNQDYNCTEKNNIATVLFNPKTKQLHQQNGNVVCHADETSEDLAIDVSDYRIVDKTKTNE